MKIFLTGATGYVGSAIAQKLLATGHQVLGLARSDSAEAKLRQRGIEPHRGDLSNTQSIEQGIRKADALIHAAGNQPAVEPGRGVVAATIDQNDLSWQNDFSRMWATERNVVNVILNALEGSGKPFIFTSGSFVVADLANGDASDVVYTEEMPFVPPSFMAPRVETEEFVRSATKRNIRSIVLRPGMVFGHNGGWQVLHLLERAKGLQTVPYIGKGENIWSTVHVDDLADLYSLALEQGSPGSLFNAASAEVSAKALAEAVSHSTSLGGKTESWTMEQASEVWGPVVAKIVATNSRVAGTKARQELGWNPHRRTILDDVEHGSYRS
ncbi:NAD-dependent epimerase/dehydratase family protein [Scytonema sp. PCC 10023]|uniref:NAD-dependent epimerase/dehydratase family protein n=1 Tax=Scytonema sp. PCC 10023 TaxID=1680591 RepID=UPI0039C72504